MNNLFVVRSGQRRGYLPQKPYRLNNRNTSAAALDPFKSMILNWGQKEKHSIVFETIEEDQKTRQIKVRLIIDDKEAATGIDFVKKKAEQIAAEKACKDLGLF